MEVLGKETNTVGLNISTKKVGSNFRDDVTDDYKYQEGTTASHIYMIILMFYTIYQIMLTYTHQKLTMSSHPTVI